MPNDKQLNLRLNKQKMPQNLALRPGNRPSDGQIAAFGLPYNPSGTPNLDKLSSKNKRIMDLVSKSDNSDKSARGGIDQMVEPKAQVQEFAKRVRAKQARITQMSSSEPSSTQTSTTTTTSTPTSSSTSGFDTTTSSNSLNTMSKSNKPERTSRGNFENEKLDRNTARYKTSEGAEFSAEDKGTNYYRPIPGAPVKFSLTLPDVTQLDQHEYAQVSSSGEVRHKLLINVSSFTASFNDVQARNPEYYNNVTSIFNRIYDDVLASNRSGLSDKLTEANFRSAMSASLEALEYYYCLDSILTFKQGDQSVDFFKVSKTFESYRNNFATDNLYNLRTKLRDTLKSCWFPPNFSQLIRWFYQNYRCSNLSQSAIYRFVCGPEFIMTVNQSNVTALETKIASLITNLSVTTATAPVRLIYTMMANCYPDGRISNLPLSSGEAVYDPRHFEIFVNDPIIWYDWTTTLPAGTTYSSNPIAYTLTSSESDLPYYQNLDPHKGDTGFPFALQTVVKSATNVSNFIDVTTAIWQGLRKPVLVSETAFSADVRQTNKFTYLPYQGSTINKACLARVGDPSRWLGTCDSHIFSAQSTTVSATVYWVTRVHNKADTGFQRVYFNNFKAPAMQSIQLMNSLFQLKPSTRL